MMGLLTKFLASKSITIVLLIVIIGLLTYLYFKSGQVHSLKSEVQTQNTQIDRQKVMINGYNDTISKLQANIVEKDRLIAEYDNQTTILNEKYKNIKVKVENLKAVNNALKTRVNSIDEVAISDNKTEAVEQANEMLDKYIYTD